MTAEVRKWVDRMQAFYERIADFTAHFEQQYRYKAFNRVQNSSGTVVFKKPGQMRWEYLKPSPKTFVLAHDRVYAHDPEAMTVTKANLGADQLSASVTFLWGKGRLADEFSIAKLPESDCADCKGPVLEMTPLRNDPRFRKIRLEIDPSSAQVARSTVVDPDGSENSFRFLELKVNQKVGDEKFKLSPPEGTQIVDLTQR